MVIVICRLTHTCTDPTGRFRIRRSYVRHLRDVVPFDSCLVLDGVTMVACVMKLTKYYLEHIPEFEHNFPLIWIHLLIHIIILTIMFLQQCQC